MGAYNELVVDVTCPVCRAEVVLVCQTYVASSFDGDETGRFNVRRYRLGERMRWWPESDPCFDEWHPEGGRGAEELAGCPGDCPACGASIGAEVQFVDVTPVAVLSVFKEEDWPRHLC